MRLVITGATGFLGGEVLQQALADGRIGQVTILTRSSVRMTHPKLREVIVENFLDYSSLDFSNCDACIWCLGISQTKVDEEEYIRITCDYTLAAAQSMFKGNPRLRFCFVSGRSADPDEASSSLFARIKGRTERKLFELDGTAFLFRPGYIRPSAKSVPRKDVGRLLAPVGAVVSLFSENLSVDCDRLARCLLDVAESGSNKQLLINRDIRNWISPAVVGQEADAGDRRRAQHE